MWQTFKSQLKGWTWTFFTNNHKWDQNPTSNIYIIVLDFDGKKTLVFNWIININMKSVIKFKESVLAFKSNVQRVIWLKICQNVCLCVRCACVGRIICWINVECVYTSISPYHQTSFKRLIYLGEFHWNEDICWWNAHTNTIHTLHKTTT